MANGNVQEHCSNPTIERQAGLPRLPLQYLFNGFQDRIEVGFLSPYIVIIIIIIIIIMIIIIIIIIMIMIMIIIMIMIMIMIMIIIILIKIIRK